MPNYTEHYKFKKPNKEEHYTVDDANLNSEIADEALFGKVDKIVGKSLSTNDFTNEYKQKLDSLKNYDETRINQEIESIKIKNDAQDTEIQKNAQDLLDNIDLTNVALQGIQNDYNKKITNLENEHNIDVEALQNKYNAIKSQLPQGQATGEFVKLEDSSDLEFDSIKISGASKQEGIPTVEEPSPIQACGENESISINKNNGNFLDIEKNASVEGNGLTVTTDEEGILTINGTTTLATYIKLHNNGLQIQGQNNYSKKKMRKGNYTISSEILSGTTDNNNISLNCRTSAVGGENIATMTQLTAVNKKQANFSLSENTDTVTYIWANTGITFNNLKLKIQINEGNTATEYVPHQGKNYVIPVQQKMLEGDTFVKIDGVWKEKHIWSYVEFDGTENWLNSTDVIGRVTLNNYISGCVPIVNNKQMCSHLNTYSAWGTNQNSFGVRNTGTIYVWLKDYPDKVQFKAFLAEEYTKGTPFRIYFQIEEPLLLNCIQEQIEVLEQIEKTTGYKNETIIYSTDEVSPQFDIKYRKDANIVREKEKAEIQGQIDEIKTLLSTTATSAVLLDNLQADLESEVE